jgi:hypothetical protein
VACAAAADPPVAARPAFEPADGSMSETPDSSIAAPETPAAPLPVEDPPPQSSCAAPSVIRLHGLDDARDPSALAECGPQDEWARIAIREQALSGRCSEAGRPSDLARVLEGALPLDGPTREHVRAVFEVGRGLGRRPDALGLVGDSMTVAPSFLRPFAVQAVLPDDVERALTVGGAGQTRSVVDVFRTTGSFLAPRAAKVGARATWPLAARSAAGTPLDAMIATVSPAYAVVLFGANDAVFRTDDVDLLARDFTAALSAIVDALEAGGVVAVLTTIPKHMRAYGVPDCARRADARTNERFAVQATALSGAVADLACRRHLPLVDLRWALDPLVAHGVGPDGVHLTVHPAGGGLLDAGGLQCGYNVRNLVTLRELSLVIDAL